MTTEEAPEIDWRDLFRRYADHVGDMEGVDFLDRWSVNDGSGHSMAPLTQAERDAIDALLAGEPPPEPTGQCSGCGELTTAFCGYCQDY